MANEIMAISYDSADAAEHAAFWSDVTCARMPR
jgi:hypothetical protein